MRDTIRRRPRYYTIVFVPDDQRRMFTLKAPVVAVKTLVVVVCVFLAGAGLLMYRAGSIAMRLQLVEHLREENRRLRQENQQLGEIRRKLELLERMHEYLERLFLASGDNDDQQQSKAIAALAVGLESNLASADLAPAGDTELRPGVHDSAASRYGERLLLAVPFIRPVQGWITRGYAEKGGRPGQHLAVDFAAAEGTPVRATAPGVVEEVSFDEFLGKVVTIRHQSGFTTRYAHCAQVLVSKGDHVERGQAVATVGSTGRSSAPHLHYEVLRNGKHVNPLEFLADQ